MMGEEAGEEEVLASKKEIIAGEQSNSIPKQDRLS